MRPAMPPSSERREKCNDLFEFFSPPAAFLIFWFMSWGLVALSKRTWDTPAVHVWVFRLTILFCTSAVVVRQVSEINALGTWSAGTNWQTWSLLILPFFLYRWPGVELFVKRALLFMGVGFVVFFLML
jgi:hypothetical protein